MIAGVAATLAVLIGLGAYLQRLGRKRTQALQAAAERMGWRFEPRPGLDVVPGPERFELFSQGYGREIRNLWQGERGGRRVSVFDYKFTTGAGKSQATWHQTVAHVHSPALRLPAFVLRPEHIFHKIGGIFGYQDIDLPADPEFSRRYLLRGEDVDAIRGRFGSAILDFYDRNPKSCTEAADADLFFWRTSRRLVPPDDVPALIDAAITLCERFESEAGAAPSPPAYG